MHNLDIAGTATILTSILTLVGAELRGVLSHRKNSATVTQEWRFADAWLKSHSPVADWMFRVFTIGFLVWTMLHFAAGVRLPCQMLLVFTTLPSWYRQVPSRRLLR